MSRKTRSARGEVVDFDLIAIKQQLAMAPTPVSVNQRRRFIDEKDGVKSKQVAPPLPGALDVAAAAAEESASKG
jgi:hypothetical protein